MKKWSRRQFVKGGIVAAAALSILDAFWFERYVIDWNYFDLAQGRDRKIKIVQLSDLHLQRIRSFHHSIARKINKIQPDLLFITGDAIDKTEKIKTLDVFLKQIERSIPKFAITGNWEYWGNVNLDELKQMYAENNCELLINENRAVEIEGREIAVIGIDDFIGGQADYGKAIQGLQQKETTIVLSHCPEHRDLIAKENETINIDLVLSGHTHGGQITFLGLVPFKPPGSGQYLKGWYETAGPKMYVSKGVGTSMLPIRFGARAEVVEMAI